MKKNITNPQKVFFYFLKNELFFFSNENRGRDAHGEAWSPITLVFAASRPGKQPANEPAAAAASAAGAAAAAASQPANEPANERGAAVAFLLN